MVYGIVLFAPVPYSLLGADHITMRVFGGFDTIPFAQNLFLCPLFGIIIHIFAPQVLMGILVFLLAIYKYRQS